jgi:hypothetical protein
MDILIPVRPGDTNEELRFSLRSLHTNYPELDTIWIVGHKPNWLTNVQYIPGNSSDNRPRPVYVYRNILAACQHPDTPPKLTITNDDIYITASITSIPVGYRKTLQQHLNEPRLKSRLQDSWWARSLRTTLHCLKDAGYNDPLSYELHIPITVNKEVMADTLQRFAHITPDNPPQWRTLYGVINNIGGQQIPDCKAHRGPIQIPFHSTDDTSFRRYAPQFAKKWPTPSPYEKTP